MTKCISLGKVTFVLVQSLQTTCVNSHVGCLEPWLCFNQLKMLLKYYIPCITYHLSSHCYLSITKETQKRCNFFHYIGITVL